MPVNDQEARRLLLSDMTADALDSESDRIRRTVIGFREMSETLSRMGEAMSRAAEGLAGFQDAMQWKPGDEDEVPPWRV